MKLGLFTDPHYCNQEVTCRTRRPVLSYGKIREAMDAFLRENVDLVLCLGDIIDHCGNQAQNIEKTEEIATLIHTYPLPFYSLMGNHDAHVFTREEFHLHTQGFLPPFSMTVGGKILIFLDANFNDDGTPYVPGKVDWKNTFLPQAQLRQLKQTLSDHRTADTYIFLHQNLDPTVQKDHIVRNAAVVREILRTSNQVKTVFQGHYHPGHRTAIDGISYYTLPAMCEGEQNRFEIIDI